MPDSSSKRKKNFYTKITSPEGLVYGGNVKSLTSVNDTGTFDILPQHTNFITIIKDKLTLKLEDGTKKEFDIDKGIVKTADNIVDVYLGIEDY